MVGVGVNVGAGIGGPVGGAGGSTGNRRDLGVGPHFRNDPIRLRGTAGGQEPLARLAGTAGRCRGFAQAQPNHTLVLQDNVFLDVLAYSDDPQGDVTLLVRGADGTAWCADREYRGRSPQIARRRFPQGTYQIWWPPAKPIAPQLTPFP
ncbi:MAG: hypothetical protein HC918_08030 [Oscillatoriales cyanobacterium SM2_1_8]|nr:hypothetical protein [Oscillatoriales cyanobacterium SM2_1_8]